MCLSRAGVIGCDDEEQVCMMSNQVQVKVISDGGYGPFCDRTPHIQHTPSLNCYRLVDATELCAPE